MEKERDEITLRQLMILVFCGMLSPMIRQVFGQMAQQAGAGGWLGPLLALPVFLLVLWLLTVSFRRLPRGTGLSGLYRMAFGPALGRGANLVTALWLLVLTSVSLRYYAETFLSSIYQGTDLWLFVVGLIAIAWWVCSRGVETVCRMSQIFLYGLCAVVGLVMALGLPETELHNVWPFWLEGWQGIAGAAVPVLAVLGRSIPILFRRDELSRTQGGVGIAAAWIFVLCVIMASLGAIILGVFGWQMTARMQMPFFSLAKEGCGFGGFERLESAVTGVWFFSDLALLSARLLAAEELVKGVVQSVNSRWVIGGMSIGAVVIAIWISPSSFQLYVLWQEYLQQWDWMVCYLLPLIGCLVMACRQRVGGKRRPQDIVGQCDESPSI